MNDVYGGTYRMFSQVYEPKGYRFSYVTPPELSDPQALAAHLDEDVALVWIETPTNPLLNIVDIRSVVESAQRVGAKVVVDNTFATPYLQRPLELGADIVVHSTTKYIGGHSDVIGGFAGTNDPVIAERLQLPAEVARRGARALSTPGSCCRGVKTLAVRMRRHCENAQAVVEFLRAHPRVEQVLYPGLPDHPGHDDRGAADARLRRHGLVPRRERGGRRRARRPHEGLDARREPRRCREPDRASGAHDARVDGGGAVSRRRET